MKVCAGKIDLAECKVGQSYYLILSEFHKLYFTKISSLIFFLLILFFFSLFLSAWNKIAILSKAEDSFVALRD